MDNFKKNLQNTLFSNKTLFIKNNKRGNSNNLQNNLHNNENYMNIIFYIIILIISVIICYLTVMTAKYLTTKCDKKISWINYILRFRYNDVCYILNKPSTPHVINKVHMMKPESKPLVAPTKSSGKIPTPITEPSRPVHEVKKNTSFPLFGKKEVFHIANQDYTYEQAKCKCESYNAELATYQQMVDAYNDGAEWCSYGWCKGQKAYYPTQKCNWQKKTPEEQIKCGNPGLNGGFFADPLLKFGVNCYGKKPKGKITKLKDPVCQSSSYCELPQNFGASNKLETDEISPFNSDKWNN